MTAAGAIAQLAAQRSEILKAELAGLLHVINRLDKRWTEHGGAETEFNTWRTVKPSVKAALVEVFDKEETEFKRWLQGQTGMSPKAAAAARRVWKSRHVTEGALTAEEESAIDGLTIKLLDEEWPIGQLTTYMDVWRKTEVEGLLDRGTKTLQLLMRSHGRASEAKAPTSGGGSKVTDGLTSVFGRKLGVDWETGDKIREVVRRAFKFTAKRKEFLTAWSDASGKVFADDREPLNDISVWQYSRAVAAFFKAGVAKVILEEKWPDPVGCVQWALFGVGYPGLEFVGSAVRISDTLARKRWVKEKLDGIQILLEETCPLGNEIYRDENGSVYLLGDCARGREMVFAIVNGELHENDDLDPNLIWEEEQGGTLPIWSVIEGIKERRPVRKERLENWWRIAAPATICPVCQLRPMAGSGKAEARSLCEVCLDRRQSLGQSRGFLEGAEAAEADTIWIDEVADIHGICALLTGRVEIKGWVEEDEATSLFRYLRSGREGEHKPPEFMRLQSAWAETKEFWQEVTDKLLPDSRRERYALNGDEAGTPYPTHVYEAAIGAGTVSAVWDEVNQRFVIASNIDYLLEQIEEGAGKLLGPKVAGRTLEFRLPRGYQKEDAGRYEDRDPDRDQEMVLLEVGRTNPLIQLSRYRPIIPILAEPRTFLAIVPALEAMKACEFIAKGYQERFEKVGSMLPLSVGAVFFDRRTPIYAVMQAGQKLLRMPNPDLEFAVKKNGAGWALVAKHQDRRMTVPMDGDEYYARLRLADGSKSVALRELGEGREVRCALSLFDFLHLETTGHRYRLAYDRDGRRLDPERTTRAFTLDQMREIEELWQVLSKGLTTPQINELFAAAEQKREDWTLEYPIVDRAYGEFCRALVKQAEWSDDMAANRISGVPELIMKGLLRDVVELHMKILKEKGRKGE